MGEKDTITRFLEFIGIKGYEARAYLTLLRMGEAPAPKIAAKAGIPLPRIYDVLENLLRRGLVEVRAGRPRIYRALPPSVSLTRYVKNYVDELLRLNEQVITALEKIYGKRESREPYIWLSHSMEASIERIRDWLTGFKIDGFASMRSDVLGSIVGTLTKKLMTEKHVVFSLTLLDDPGERIMKRLMKVDNLMVLRQSTGFINALELDSKQAVIYGRGYTLFTTEPELLALLNDTYYFGYWRNAEVLKEIAVEPPVMYRTTHHWLALRIVHNALDKGYTPWLHIIGRYTANGKPVEMRARAIDTYRSPDDKTRTILVVDEAGEKHSVGGLGASVEEIEARYIEIEVKD